jgi:hypothetical protein
MLLHIVNFNATWKKAIQNTNFYCNLHLMIIHMKYLTIL